MEGCLFDPALLSPQAEHFPPKAPLAVWREVIGVVADSLREWHERDAESMPHDLCLLRRSLGVRFRIYRL